MITEQVLQLIHKYMYFVSDFEVKTDHTTDDLGIDSLYKVELVMFLEEAFDVELHDDDLERVETVQELIDLIQNERYGSI